MSEHTTTPTSGLADPAARRALVAGFDATPGAAKPDPILVVDNIVRQFGGMTAVDVDHLEVQRGLITALIGPNGAGKTTFFNLITGFDRPTTAGKGAHWAFDGRTLDKTSASSVARAGMVRTFQLTKALSRMTVIDNMMLGAQNQAGENLLKSLFRRTWRGQEKEIEAKADELLARFKLYEKKHDYAGSLSGGQRKLLEMARALMSDPKMIMLDEPMAGREPGADPVAPRPHPEPARRGHDRAVRRARHARRTPHLRLGRGDGRGPAGRRGCRRHRHVEPRRDRRLPRCAPRHRPR